MANKKTLLVVIIALFLSVAIAAISFSIDFEKQTALVPHEQKMSSSSVQQKSTMPTAVPAAKQLHENRLQVALQKYQQMKKQRQIKVRKDNLPQNKPALQEGLSWLDWPLGKRVDQSKSRQSIFPYAGVTASAAKNISQSPDLIVVSTYPGDQATNVPLDTIISVTFSDSLDRYAPLEISFFPNARSLSDPVISADGKTVSASATLDSNMTYQLTVMTAATPDSQRIKPRVAATFSTGSTMAAGSIYGKITLPLDPSTNMTLAAVFSMEMMDSDEPYRIAEITTSDGSYSIENLPSGDYLLLAVQDINGDLQFNESDLFGFYDPDANGEPDPIFVSEGQATGSFDFQLTVLEVVSSYPGDSTLNLPTEITVSITFSLPVDYEDEDFEIGIFPAPIDRSPISASPDGKTVYMPVILKDSTVYQILITGAKTSVEPEQIQIEPYIAYFSTGSSFQSATISGTVNFADFAPSMAFAFLVPPHWQGDEKDISNVTEINLSDGSYVIINVPPGTYYPAFFSSIDDQEVFAMYSDSVVVSEGDAISGIDMTMALGTDIALYGRITGSGGISGVDIEAYNTTEDQRFEAQSNFLGYYRMMIFDGLYNIRFEPPRRSSYIAKDTTDIAIATDTELNVTLGHGFFIFGVVSNTSGAPIQDVYIEVADPSTQNRVAESSTNEQGEYRISVPSGTYDVSFHPWQSRYIGTQITNVTVSADYELNVVLQSGSLVDGTVTNQDSIPLDGVGVMAFLPGSWDAVSGTATDENGYYAFGLLPGTYDIFCDPFWNYSEYLTYTITNVNVRDDTTINMVLERGAIISGRVTDPEDDPVEGAQVEALDTLYNWVADNWTDDNGNYSLAVPAGTYHVRVWPHLEQLAAMTIHDITVPPDTILDIQLRYPQLWIVTGMVTDSSSAPMDSVRLDIRNERTFDRNDTTITDANGQYTVQLLDGRYSIIFRSGKWYGQGFPNQAASPPIAEIFSDTTIDFALRTGSALTGTVNDTSNNPVENAFLSFREPVSRRSIRGTPTNVNGYYSVLLVPASYRAEITPPPFSNLFRLGSEVYFTGIETYDYTLKSIPVHDVGNVVFSWAAGQYGLVWNNGGQGFQYPPGQSNNHLWNSYLLIAINDNQISEEGHFQPLNIPPYIVTTPGVVSDQDGYTVFDDSKRRFPVGITVSQYSYAYANAPDNDYVILRLVITNNDPFSKDIVTGMYFDWDLGNSGDDVGDYDAVHSLGYVYDSGASDSIHVGTAVLSVGGATSYRVYDRFSEGYLDWSDKYTTLTEGFQQTHAGPGDLRYYIASGPFTLAPAGQDSIEVAFAILAGNNLLDLQANAEAALAKYKTAVSVDEKELPVVVPRVFSLSQNYPNPFNPETIIQFGLPKPSRVRLIIYNLLGQKVKTLVDAKKMPGFYTIHWDGMNDYGNQMASGMYIYRIEAGQFIRSKKLLLLR